MCGMRRMVILAMVAIGAVRIMWRVLGPAERRGYEMEWTALCALGVDGHALGDDLDDRDLPFLNVPARGEVGPQAKRFRRSGRQWHLGDSSGRWVPAAARQSAGLVEWTRVRPSRQPVRVRFACRGNLAPEQERDLCTLVKQSAAVGHHGRWTVRTYPSRRSIFWAARRQRYGIQ